MKKIYILAAVAIAIGSLSGCAEHRYDSSSDRLFQLSERHIVFRDLTVPAMTGNEPRAVHMEPLSVE